MELFPVYHELNHGDAARTRPSVYIATLICFAVYATVSVVVVLTFGTDLHPNSLYNVPADNYWITFLCFALVIVITLLYPLINYPMLNAIETILDLCGCCRRRHREDGDEFAEDAIAGAVLGSASLLSVMAHPSLWWSYVVLNRRDFISVLGIFVVIAVDIGVNNLNDLFGLCGSLGLSFVCYIFPCLIWMVTKFKRGELSMVSPQVLFTLIVLLFSSAVMVYSTAVILISLAE